MTATSPKFSKEEQSFLNGLPVKEVIKIVAGRPIPAPNGWGDCELCGAWRFRGVLRFLLAARNAENAVELFNHSLEELSE